MTRELIKRLYACAQACEAGECIGEGEMSETLTEAADALEATLWKPIADMPEELKDGRDVLLANGNICILDRCDCGVWYNFNDYWKKPTHYIEITPPIKGE